MSAQVEAGAGVTRVRRKDRSRQVWIVLALSTIGFFAICGVLSAGLYRYLSSITVQQPASVEVRQGTQVTVQRRGRTSQELVNKASPISEGDWVTTGPDSEGFLNLFEGGITVQTYFGTLLRLDSLRTTRFFQDHRSMSLTLNTGTIVVSTGESGTYTDERYIVATDMGSILVGPASKVRIERTVAAGPVTASVDKGTATLMSGGLRSTLEVGLMGSLEGGGAISGPLPAEKDLVYNGDFTEQPTRRADEVANGGLGTAVWVPFREQTPGSESVATSVNLVSEKVGSTLISAVVMNATVLPKQGVSEHYAKAGVRQDINQPVDYLQTIDLHASVKVVRQPARIGGPVGDVYPLTIRVNYSDTNGKSQSWSQNFQLKTGKADSKDQGQVRQAQWSPMYFRIKSKDVGQNMAVLDSIEIFGYGAEYESWVTGVKMIARSTERNP